MSGIAPHASLGREDLAMALELLGAAPEFNDGTYERDPLQLGCMALLNALPPSLDAAGHPGAVYQGPLGLGVLKAPYRVTALSDGRLATCDYRAHAVLLFRPDGSLAGRADRGFDHPWRAFESTDRTLWVSDFGSGRLLALDPDDLSLRREVRLADVPGVDPAAARPMDGCCQGDDLHLILCNAAEQHRGLYRLSAADPTAGARRIPLPTHRPNVLRADGNRLVVGRDLPGGALSVEPSGALRSLDLGLPLGAIRDLALGRDRMFAVLENRVLELRPGQPPRALALPALPGQPQAIPYGAAFANLASGPALYVTDLAGGIHCFHLTE